MLKSAPAKKPGRLFLKHLRQYRILLLMLMPALLYTIIFSYIPLPGIVLAFKRYDYTKGIFGSAWVGWQNFKFFFMSGQAFQVTMNTALYNIAFIASGLVVSLSISVFLSEMRGSLAKKTSQTLMFLPHFVSWVVAAAIVYNLLNKDYGLVNSLRRSLGLDAFSAYTTPAFWPPFLVLLNLWKGAGYGSVVYLAAITGIDQEVHEAARIDGANIWQRTMHVTLPGIKPIIILQLLFSIGGIFAGNFDMFYNIIGKNSLLYNTTDVIDTVVFRSLLNSNNLGMTTAIGLFQQVLCFTTIMLVNAVIRKVEPDSALF